MSDTHLKLLTALATASHGAHTRPAITRRVAETLSKHLPLAFFELGWLHDGHDRVHIVLMELSFGEHAITEVTRELHNTHAHTALQNHQPHTFIPQPQTHRDALQLGAHVLLVLPLFDDHTPTGFATLALTQHHPALDEPHLIEAITAILHVAHHNTRLIEKVARIAQRAHREKQQLRLELERFARPKHFVTSSPAMRRIYSAIELVARHDTTVLLRGESGTGKERLARLIHEHSSRSNRPFITVNCGALPEHLIESELFGHERGAFTGASSRHLGRFERAHNGTLLLDEVAELPLPAQVKLLRVLQEAEFERVGGENTLHVDVRIIAATHRDLEAMVNAGTFRADLYYRLSVFPIHIPPLRERTEDIQTLSELLLLQLSERLERTPPALPTATLARLTRYTWPGNVRELENALERALILSRGAPRLEPHHLDPILVLPNASPRSLGASSHNITAEPQSLEQATRRAIEHALTHTRGRIYGESGAAEVLGLKPSTLQSKMKKLGIERTAFLQAHSNN